MEQGLRIRDFESSWRRFERISWTIVQSAVVFLFLLLATTILSVAGITSFVKLLFEIFMASA
jgi:hypothetical protein